MAAGMYEEEDGYVVIGSAVPNELLYGMQIDQPNVGEMAILIPRELIDKPTEPAKLPKSFRKSVDYLKRGYQSKADRYEYRKAMAALGFLSILGKIEAENARYENSEDSNDYSLGIAATLRVIREEMAKQS